MMFVLLLLFLSGNWTTNLPDTRYPLRRVEECEQTIYLSSTREIFMLRKDRWEKIFSSPPYSGINDMICYDGQLLILTRRKIYTLQGLRILGIAVIPSNENGIGFVPTRRGNLHTLMVATTSGIYTLSRKLIPYKLLPSFKITSASVGMKRILFSTYNQLWIYSNGNYRLIGTGNVKAMCFCRNRKRFYLIGKNINILLGEDLIKPFRGNYRNLKCSKGDIVTITDTAVKKNNRIIYETDSDNRIIDAIYSGERWVILTEKNLVVWRESSPSSVYEYGSTSTSECLRLPPLAYILKRAEPLRRIDSLLHRDWLENSRKRALIPRITISGNIDLDRGGYRVESDNISVSSYNQIVIIGPPSTTLHTDRQDSYSVSLSLTWDPERILFDPDELSIAYRITDLLSEKDNVINQIIERYRRTREALDECCTKNDQQACRLVRDNLTYFKFITGVSREE